MKAILIIDMPKNCMECRIKYLDTGDDVYCCAWDGSEILKRGKDEWCPLKPMPSREDIHEEIYQAYGLGKEEPYIRMRDAFDKVLDEMLGEEE